MNFSKLLQWLLTRTKCVFTRGYSVVLSHFSLLICRVLYICPPKLQANQTGESCTCVPLSAAHRWHTCAWRREGARTDFNQGGSCDDGVLPAWRHSDPVNRRGFHPRSQLAAGPSLNAAFPPLRRTSCQSAGGRGRPGRRCEGRC